MRLIESNFLKVVGVVVEATVALVHKVGPHGERVIALRKVEGDSAIVVAGSDLAGNGSLERGTAHHSAIAKARIGIDEHAHKARGIVVVAAGKHVHIVLG